ncbi:MAG: T9SS type A sorting domain-containing protein, partial [Ekhidna sp.]|nr:T9SS type A sorting domain-containing protein [Ekhidna sp.]
GDFNAVDIIGDPAITLSTRSEFDLSVYPNPISNRATIRFEGDGKPIELQLLDLKGTIIENIYNGVSTRGANLHNWDTSNIVKGRYFVLLRSNSGKQVFSVVK